MSGIGRIHRRVDPLASLHKEPSDPGVTTIVMATTNVQLHISILSAKVP